MVGSAKEGGSVPGSRRRGGSGGRGGSGRPVRGRRWYGGGCGRKRGRERGCGGRGHDARGCQAPYVHQGVEGRAGQRQGDVGRRTDTVDQGQYGALAGGDRGRGRAAGPDERGAVRGRVGPDAVQQGAAAQGLVLQRRHRHRAHGTEPVPVPVPEVPRRAGGREGEVRRVVQRPQMAHLQGAHPDPAALHQEPSDAVPLAGLGDRVPPAVGVQRAPCGEQDVETGHGRALGVHHLTVGEVERAALPDQDAGGLLGGEPAEYRRDPAPRPLPGRRPVPHRQARGRSRRCGPQSGHPSTSRPAISPSRMRASARLPSARASHRCRNTLLSKVVVTNRRT